jgi:hypothetical protein
MADMTFDQVIELGTTLLKESQLTALGKRPYSDHIFPDATGQNVAVEYIHSKGANLLSDPNRVQEKIAEVLRELAGKGGFVMSDPPPFVEAQDFRAENASHGNLILRFTLGRDIGANQILHVGCWVYPPSILQLWPAEPDGVVVAATLGAPKKAG